MTKGWKNIDNQRYFFGNDGTMVTGWQEIGNKKYYFDSNGQMVTGKREINGLWYTFDSSGVMTTAQATLKPTPKPTPKPTLKPTPKPTPKPTATRKPTATPHQHKWRAATYTSPEKCTICGATRGAVKGYIGNVYGSNSDTSVTIMNWNTYPLIFSGGIRKCMRFTLTFQITDYTSKGGGKNAYIFVHESNGKWRNIGEIEYSSEDISNHRAVSKNFYFDSPITFDKLTVIPQFNGRNFYWRISLSNVQVNVD